MATPTGRNALPQRFRPFYDQALTSAELRYGAQESGLSSILAQLTNDYGRQSTAQRDAGMSVLGALKGADQNLQQVYSDAGLNPTVLSQIAGSPTGQRLAGELAGNRADVLQQINGAQAGQQYIQGNLADQYRQDVGQVSQQGMALAKERGLFTGSVLDELIGNDRSARSAANQAAREAAAAQQQQALDRATSTGNALIGQGLAPVIGEDGSVSIGQPLPGGKADPNAKPKSGIKPATPAAVKAATGTYSQAVDYARKLWESGIDRRKASDALMRGREASEGQDVYDPQTGKPIINPDGTKKTTKGKSEIPSFKADQPLLQAALDIAYDGHVSPATVRKLHKAYGNGIVGALGLKTDRKAPRPKRPKPVGYDDLNSQSPSFRRPGEAPLGPVDTDRWTRG